MHALKGTEDKIGRDKIIELMAAIDSYIPEPTRALDKPFSMPVEDVFSIQGRGTVATGRVEQGIVRTGEEVDIVGITPTKKTTVTGVEMFKKTFNEGQAGDNCGLLLRGLSATKSYADNSCASRIGETARQFEAEVYVLKKERADVTPHSSPTTVRNSSCALPISPVTSRFRKARRWPYRRQHHRS